MSRSRIPTASFGRPEPHLAARLQAFKCGVRKNDAMSMVALSLSDQDIDDLATYFSAIKIIAGKLREIATIGWVHFDSGE
jgi:cytochrome c553